MKELIILLLGCAVIPFIGYLSCAISQLDDIEKPDDEEQEEWIRRNRK